MLVTSGAIVALLIGYGVYWWEGQKEIQNIKDLLSGELLAHWQFHPQEWESILQKRIAKMKWSPKDYKSALGCAVPVGLIFGGGIMLWAIFGKGPERVYLMLLGVGVLLFFPGVAVFQGLWSHFTAWRIWHQRHRNPAPHLYVAIEGLYHDADGYLDFQDLNEISLSKSQPPVLKLKFAENIDGKNYKVTHPVELPQLPAETLKSFVKSLRASLS